MNSWQFFVLDGNVSIKIVGSWQECFVSAQNNRCQLNGWLNKLLVTNVM